MSEWYPEDLQALLEVMEKLPDLAVIEGIYEVEVKVRTDMDAWAVIGYGESGDPCVLRFEEPVKEPVKPNLYTINTINTGSIPPPINTGPLSPWAPPGGHINKNTFLD